MSFVGQQAGKTQSGQASDMLRQLARWLKRAHATAIQPGVNLDHHRQFESVRAHGARKGGGNIRVIDHGRDMRALAEFYQPPMFHLTH